jgi:hypothetical protein
MTTRLRSRPGVVAIAWTASYQADGFKALAA